MVSNGFHTSPGISDAVRNLAELLRKKSSSKKKLKKQEGETILVINVYGVWRHLSQSLCV